MEKNISADYSWHTKANAMLRKRKAHHLQVSDLADWYGMMETEVRELLAMRDHAADYLRSRGNENLWSLVSDREDSFRAIVEGRAKLTTTGEKELFKEAAFILIDNPHAGGGRLYEAIPGIQEYIGEIKHKLQARFHVQAPTDETGLGGLFGGQPSPEGGIDIPLAEEVKKPENVEEARQIIVDVIEGQRQLKKEAKTANFLLKKLMDANARLEEALQGLRPEAKTDGVAAQLDQLEAKLSRIRQWLTEHA